MKFLSLELSLATACLGLLACSNNTGVSPGSSGGSPTKTGGISHSSGGSASAGGVVASGGASSTGGASLALGGSASGGSPIPAAGGAAGGGADSGLGGSAGSGGSSGFGGRDGGGVGGKPSATGGAVNATGGTGTQAGDAGAGGKAGATGGAGGTMGGTGGVPASGGTSAGTGGTSSTSAGTGAPETKPLGYGQATTGGGNAAAVTVATMAAVQAAIDGYSGSGGLVLKYTGKFDFKTITDPCVQHTLPAQKVEIKNTNDITILGADGSAANFGIHIAGSSSNIIIRNMTIGLTPGGSDSDIISLEGMSGGVPKNIWIDHNELFTSMAECAGAGDTAFDGMIDTKKGADNVTVSYNYMHDHHKVSLNGYTDSDDATRHITFHHNLFENVGSRTPLQRHGYSHMLNNYFSKVLVTCINVRMGGYSLVEANYFENVLDPVTARDSSAVGYWDLRNNNLATKADVSAGNKFGITWDSGSSGTVNATDWTTTAAFPVALGYSYTADPFQCVHDGLRAAAGAGKGLATLTCK